jgi:hypothetical protein
MTLVRGSSCSHTCTCHCIIQAGSALGVYYPFTAALLSVTAGTLQQQRRLLFETV